MQHLLDTAMRRSDELVIQMEYTDTKGRKNTRVVSPIRFLRGGRFLALCLCRCEPRQFYIPRCQNLRLKPAHDFVMPVPITAA